MNEWRGRLVHSILIHSVLDRGIRHSQQVNIERSAVGVANEKKNRELSDFQLAEFKPLEIVIKLKQVRLGKLRLD